DEHDSPCSDQAEEIEYVEPERFPYFVVQRVRPPKDLPECPRIRERNADCPEEAGIEETYGDKRPHPRVRSHHHLGGLGGTVDVHAVEKGPGHDDNEDRDENGEEGPDNRVELPPRDILLFHIFINYSALLEEDHPWRDRCPDVCHQ